VTVAVPITGMLTMLNRRVDVYRPEKTSDGQGGHTVSMVLQASDRPAKVSQPDASEQRVADQDGAKLTHVVHMTPTEDVQRGDELRGGGETFRVISAVTPSHAVYLRLGVEQLQSEPSGVES
jgi:head-tail adaptor